LRRPADVERASCHAGELPKSLCASASLWLKFVITMAAWRPPRAIARFGIDLRVYLQRQHDNADLPYHFLTA